ncbi:MAG: hypothetical protein ACRCZP_20080, partial [Phycicoccus sp.]
LAVVDEGEKLTKLAERAGATLGATLRSAWSGARIGESGATEQTQRRVNAHTYTLGMITGYQLELAGPVLLDHAAGTPQRIMWASAVDPRARARVPWPGTLCVGHLPGAGALWRDDTQIIWDDRILAWVQDDAVRAHHGDTRDPLDAHEPAQRLKLAGLLALLHGRTHVDMADWATAAALWATSCAVRAAILTHGQAVRDHEERQDRARRVTTAAAVAAVTRDVDRAVHRVARRLAQRTADAGGLMSRADAFRDTASRDRGGFDAACEHAVDRGLLTSTDPLMSP